MIPLLKFGTIALVAATAFWVSAALYLRSHKRERLEEAARGLAAPERADFIRRELREWDRALRRWSLIAVYAAVAAVVAGIVWHVNFN